MALIVSRRLNLDLDVRGFLDLVALGTVGDVMPMNRTNRILVSKGIALMESILRGGVDKPGIRALLKSRDKSFVSLWHPSWHVGVLGIVAGKLADQLGRPVAVFSRGKHQSVGSVRSVEGVNVYEGLKQLSSMFLKWGGHTQAAGLTLSSELLEEFSARAEEVFSSDPAPLRRHGASPREPQFTNLGGYKQT